MPIRISGCQLVWHTEAGYYAWGHWLDPIAHRVVLGKVIAALRERARPRLTQADLARSVGVAQATISRIEAGLVTPDVYTFNRIAAALGVTPAQLHELVDDAVSRTTRAAAGAGAADPDVITSALKLAGIAGLAGLAVFAVAALLGHAEDDSPKPRTRRRGR